MKIYQSIKELITNQRLGQAASVLGEKETNIASAVAHIIPTLLGKLHTKGATQAIKETIGMAEKHNLYGALGHVWEGNGIVDHLNIGERFENDLVSPHSKEFTTSVASKAGINYESADRLSNWVSATIAAWFAHESVSQKKPLATLIKEIGDDHEVVGATAAHTVHHTAPKPAPKPAPKKKSMAWLWWLLALILLALIAFFLIRSCDSKKVKEVETKVVETVKVDPNKALTDLRASLLRDFGVQDRATEIQMIDFLTSSDYKNATADQLKNKWFHFDHVDFEHASAVEMMPGAKAQVVNIAKVLKAFPEAKLMIAGYADKTGGKAVNDEISAKRAEYIKRLFAENGIAANRISTEGFGKEFATHPASAPDAERALDRHFALRFMK